MPEKRQPQNVTQTSPAGSDEELMEVLAGREVDRVLSEQEAELAAPCETVDGTELEESPASQSDIDAILARADAINAAGPAEGEPLVAAPPAEDEPFGQDELDALLAAAGGASVAPEPVAGGSAGPVDGHAPSEQAAVPGETPSSVSMPIAEGGALETPASDPVDDEEGPLSQADLDALLAAAAGGGQTAPTPEQGGVDQPDASAVDGQGAQALPETPPAQAAGDETLSQADLDALVATAAGGDGAAAVSEQSGEDRHAPPSAAAEAVQSEASPSEQTADDGPLSQADLDALLAAAAGDDDGDHSPEGESPLTASEELPAAAAAEDGPLSQADLDALLATAAGAVDGNEVSPDPIAPGATDGFSEAGQPSQTPPSPHNDAEVVEDDTLSQADLDALLAVTAGSELPATSVDGAEDAASQDDIDALPGQVTGAESPTLDTEPRGESDADRSAPADSGEAMQAGSGNNVLTQGDLDALLATAAAVDEGPPNPAESTATAQAKEPPAGGAAAHAAAGAEDEGALRQEDLDALLAQAAGQAPGPETAPVAELPSTAEPDGEVGETLSPEGLDAFLREQAPAAQGPAEAAAPAVDTDLPGGPEKDSASEPIMSMDELDNLLAQRANEVGQTEPEEDLNVSDHSMVTPEELSSLTGTTSAAPAASASASASAEAPEDAPKSTGPADTSRAGKAVPKAAKVTAADVGVRAPRSLGMGGIYRLMGLMNRPFEQIPPNVRGVLGYAGFALLFASLLLILAGFVMNNP